MQIFARSTEDEVEVLVRLVDPKKHDDFAILDQQTLLITTEAVFHFGPITSAASDELSIEVMYFESNLYLMGKKHSVMGPWNLALIKLIESWKSLIFALWKHSAASHLLLMSASEYL